MLKNIKIFILSITSFTKFDKLSTQILPSFSWSKRSNFTHFYLKSTQIHYLKSTSQSKHSLREGGKEKY